MIGAGKTVSQIAEELHLSVATISTYRARILEKMNMTTNAELMRYAFQSRAVSSELANCLQASRPESKDLYMSGQTEDTSVHHSTLEAGPSYLLKPFTPETLARKVREVLDLPIQPR